MPYNSKTPLENASRLKAIIDTAIDGIITIDTQGMVETVNPAVSKIFGYAADEIIGNNIKMLMPEPDKSKHDQYLHNYLDTGVKKIIGIGREVLGRKKDGTLFPFLLSISEVQLEDKKIFTGVIHDITQLKKAESDLKESESRINAIINTAVDGIITINERGIMEMLNPSAVKMFGYNSAEELIGKNVSFLAPEPDKSRHDGYLDNYHKTGKKKIIGIGREVSGLRKDGTTFPFILSVSEMNIEGRRIYTGFVHDVTGQKMNEEKLRRYASELQRSNHELQDFAYVSSHDLQEPLRKIQAFGDRLKSKETESLSEQGKDYVDRMLNAASRMQKLINDLLEFSRVTSKAQPFTAINLNTVLQEVISDLEISIEKNKVKISAENLPSIEGDATQLRQLFQNLLSNAIKFRKEGGNPEIKISARKKQRQPHMIATPGDEMVELYVEDNGIGFEEKYLDKIFNIFQRLEGQKYEGSGIGLAICRKIAIRHGGNITARSQPGKGTTFIVTLATKQTSE
ncbi:MAG: PAS domain S-box protein [Cytophagaceae bacterium]